MEIYSIYVNRPCSKFDPNFNNFVPEDIYFTDVELSEHRIELSVNRTLSNPSSQRTANSRNEHTSIQVRNKRRGNHSYDEINYARYNFSNIFNKKKVGYTKKKALKIFCAVLFATICLSIFIVGLFLTLNHSDIIKKPTMRSKMTKTTTTISATFQTTEPGKIYHYSPFYILLIIL